MDKSTDSNYDRSWTGFSIVLVLILWISTQGFSKFSTTKTLELNDFFRIPKYTPTRTETPPFTHLFRCSKTCSDKKFPSNLTSNIQTRFTLKPLIETVTQLI